jgi:RHS repeat-associated protein
MNGLSSLLIRAVLAVVVLAACVAPAVAQEVVEYIHTDALGSPVAITDAGGNVIERTVYEPYGAVVNRPLKDGPGYTGHVTDSGTGLSYMQQRYYDPAIGSFISADPVEANGHTSSNFNRYKYALGNPYGHVDPDGRCESVSTCQMMRDDLAVINGEMGLDERRSRQEARAAGAVAGVSVLAASRIPAATAAVIGGAKNAFINIASRVASLTRSQQQAIKKINNIVDNNAKPHDFDGVAKELRGIETGFDHVTEMQNSLKGLSSAAKSLRGSLNNPSLSRGQRVRIQRTLDKADENIAKMKETLGGGR